MLYPPVDGGSKSNSSSHNVSSKAHCQIIHQENHVKGIMKRGFEDALGVEARHSVLTGAEIELPQRLNEKHRSRDWIYRMDDKRRRQRQRRRNKPQVH